VQRIRHTVPPLSRRDMAAARIWALRTTDLERPNTNGTMA